MTEYISVADTSRSIRAHDDRWKQHQKLSGNSLGKITLMGRCVTKGKRKQFFRELAFICVQTGLGSNGESLPDVGVFGATATATATAKLHIGWFEQTL